MNPVVTDYPRTLLLFIKIRVFIWASVVAQLVKNLPAMQESWFLSLGQEDPLEKRTATHCSILAWRIPWTEEESFAFIKDLFI